MCQIEPWGAIAVIMEANSTQGGQPLRMHGSTLLKYGQKNIEYPPPVPLNGVNWHLGWDSQDLAGRPLQGPAPDEVPLLNQNLCLLNEVQKHIDSIVICN